MNITITDLNLRWGTKNIINWSNLENTTSSANTAAVQEAIDWADAQVYAQFNGSGYIVPLEVGPYSEAMVRAWLTSLAAWQLYTGRGLRDTDIDTKMQIHYNRAFKEMREVLDGQRKLDATKIRNDVPTGPEVV